MIIDKVGYLMYFQKYLQNMVCLFYRIQNQVFDMNEISVILTLIWPILSLNLEIYEQNMLFNSCDGDWTETHAVFLQDLHTAKGFKTQLLHQEIGGTSTTVTLSFSAFQIKTHPMNTLSSGYFLITMPSKTLVVYNITSNLYSVIATNVVSFNFGSTNEIIYLQSGGEKSYSYNINTQAFKSLLLTDSYPLYHFHLQTANGDNLLAHVCNSGLCFLTKFNFETLTNPFETVSPEGNTMVANYSYSSYSITIAYHVYENIILTNQQALWAYGSIILLYNLNSTLIAQIDRGDNKIICILPINNEYLVFVEKEPSGQFFFRIYDYINQRIFFSEIFQIDVAYFQLCSLKYFESSSLITVKAFQSNQIYLFNATGLEMENNITNMSNSSEVNDTGINTNSTESNVTSNNIESNGTNSTQSNTTGNSTEGNTTGNSTEGNTIGNSTEGNTTGNSTEGNTTGNNTEGNTANNSTESNFTSNNTESNGTNSTQSNTTGNNTESNFTSNNIDNNNTNSTENNQNSSNTAGNNTTNKTQNQSPTSPDSGIDNNNQANNLNNGKIDYRMETEEIQQYQSKSSETFVNNLKSELFSEQTRNILKILTITLSLSIASTFSNIGLKPLFTLIDDFWPYSYHSKIYPEFVEFFIADTSIMNILRINPLEDLQVNPVIGKLIEMNQHYFSYEGTYKKYPYESTFLVAIQQVYVFNFGLSLVMFLLAVALRNAFKDCFKKKPKTQEEPPFNGQQPQKNKIDFTILFITFAIPNTSIIIFFACLQTNIGYQFEFMDRINLLVAIFTMFIWILINVALYLFIYEYNSHLRQQIHEYSTQSFRGMILDILINCIRPLCRSMVHGLLLSRNEYQLITLFSIDLLMILISFVFMKRFKSPLTFVLMALYNISFACFDGLLYCHEYKRDLTFDYEQVFVIIFLTIVGITILQTLNLLVISLIDFCRQKDCCNTRVKDTSQSSQLKSQKNSNRKSSIIKSGSKPKPDLNKPKNMKTTSKIPPLQNPPTNLANVIPAKSMRNPPLIFTTKDLQKADECSSITSYDIRS